MVIPYSAKPISGLNRVEKVDWKALREQFNQPFNPIVILGKSKWQVGEISNGDGNETLDEFSYRVTQLGKSLCLNDQNILGTFKLGYFQVSVVCKPH